MKPDIRSYIKFLKVNNIKPNDKCIFFEDSKINLETAKLFNWTTVYIGDKCENNFIDYSFETIHDALEFFVNN